MTINDYSFRDLYHKYILIKNIDRKLNMYNMEFVCHEGDNAILTYGYIDHEAGLTFEVLCFANKNEAGGIELRPGNESVSFKIRSGSIDGDIEIIPYDIRLMEFRDKVDMINDAYAVSKELELIREHTSIDNDRDKQFPDDVRAMLFKNGVQTELIWVRTETIIDGKVAGVLINQPHSDAFGLKLGDMVKLVSIPLETRYATVIETSDIYA